MPEAMPVGEPVNPGSLADYIKERSHPAVGISEFELRREWEDKLTRYRLGLAAEQGITLEDLHDGILSTIIPSEQSGYIDTTSAGIKH